MQLHVRVYHFTANQQLSGTGEAGSERTLIILQNPIPPCKPFCHRARL